MIAASRSQTGSQRDWRTWLAGKVGRKGDKTFRVRILVQSGFALTCVLLGIQFGRFVSAARAGDLPLPHRPPGVEGFLPISGLMGLLDWIYQASGAAISAPTARCWGWSRGCLPRRSGAIR